MSKLSILLGFTVFSAVPCVFSQDDASINKASTIEFGRYVRQQVKSNAVDLNAPFMIEVTGILSRSGKIDPASLKYIRAEGDKAMIEIAKRAIEAVNEAGYLLYLQDFGGREIRISARQDESVFVGEFIFELESEARAKTIATLFTHAVQFKKTEQKEGRARSSTSPDDQILLDSISVTPASKFVTIDFRMSKKTFRDMIDRALAK